MIPISFKGWDAVSIKNIPQILKNVVILPGRRIGNWKKLPNKKVLKLKNYPKKTVIQPGFKMIL